MALCLSMVLSYVPVSAHADSIADQPHTEHTVECGYVEAVEGQPCTHVHSESCYESVSCVHICGEECAEGCAHSCSVESGCITMVLDCHHTHDADCGYSEGAAEIPCGHIHDESCGYAPAVEAAPCTHNCEESGCTLNEDGTYTCLHTEHDDACGYAEGGEEIPCTHTHDETCGYAPATEGTPCNHICSVIVGSSESCYKLLCSHAEEGQHDESCGYVEAVEGHPCKYENTESEAVAKVQAMIDALPDATDATEADRAAVEEAYNAFCELTAEQMAQITGVEKLTALVDLLSGRAETLEGEVSYIYRTYNTSTNAVESTTKSVTEYTTVTSDMTTWSNGWYVVESDVTISSRITVSGNNVHLILMDGCTLTATEGITVNAGNGLTIYGQSDKDEQMGKLIAVISSTSAAIGSTIYNDAGNITIMGGSVTAENTNMSDGVANTGGAGIGGSNSGSGGTVTIFGGNVSATGGMMAPGIGGCKDSVGTITIFGGTVTASGRNNTGYYSGAGIGACGNKNIDKGTISIFGGTVTANGGESSAGIGGGNKTTSVNITILGGSVNATAGDDYDVAIGCKSYSMLSLSDDGQTATVKGNYTLPYSYTIPSGLTLVIPSGASLTVPSGVTLKNYGTVVLDDGGSLVYPVNTGVSQIPRGLTTGTIKIGSTELVWNSSVNAYRCKNGCTYGSDNICTVCGHCSTMTPNDEGYYEIHNASELFYFAELVNSGKKDANARLINDIDMSGYVWNVICQTDTYHGSGSAVTDAGYAGIFDGNGHIISNLTVTGGSEGIKSYGLFGTVSGTIKRLGLDNFTFNVGSADCRAGGIAGQVVEGGLITDCYIVNSNILTDSRIAGGIAGCNYGGTVQNCFAYHCTVTGYGTRWGMVVGDCRDDGEAKAGVVKNCYTDKDRVVSTQNTSANITGCEVISNFTTGEVAYKLNGGVTDGTQAWYQTLNADEYPKFTGGTVYASSPCPVYSNSKQNGDKPHSFTANGFCTVCGTYEPAPKIGDYYEISNAGQLYWFAEQVNSGNTGINGKLMKDIVVNTNVLTSDGKLNGDGFRSWTPFCMKSGEYSGIFDGQNKTISGLYYSDSSESYVGFIGYAKNAIIRNLTVKDSYFNGAKRIGGIVGYMSGGKISRCCNEGSVVKGISYVGGIVGVILSNCTIEMCYNVGKITGTDQQIGGIAGVIAGSSVMGCYNIGNISGGMIVGGISGLTQQGAKITGCYNAGVISGKTKGGIVGYNSYRGDSCTVADCYYDLNVFGGDVYGGNKGTVESSSGKTSEEFKSGEVTWLLNGNSSDGVWKQTIGTDTYPSFTGDTVYRTTVCGVEIFSNTKIDAEHEMQNGICTRCGFCESDEIYYISTAEQLVLFAQRVNGGTTNANAVVMADIDLSGVFFLMIGTSSNPYSGTFNGNGHKITLDLTTAGQYTALFRYVNGATIQNLIVDGTITVSNKFAASIVGKSDGTTTIENCISAVKIVSTLANDGTHGGLVANVQSGTTTIKNCGFIGSIEGANTHACGGMVGWSQGTTKISNSYVAATFTVNTKNGNTFARNPNNVTVENCYYLNALGDTPSGATQMTAEQFRFGEVAYKLNGDQTNIIWKQTIGTDDYPNFTGKTVYYAVNCTSTGKSYANTAAGGSHTYDKKGFCANTSSDETVCGAYQPCKGEGTETNPYQISNAGQLMWFAAVVNGGYGGTAQNKGAYGILTADIDMSGVSYTPITSTALYYTTEGTDKGYTGVFDGDFHVIKNLTVTGSSTEEISYGLFGTLSGTVKNLGIDNFTYNDNKKDCRVGAIAGQVLSGGVIIDCYVVNSTLKTNNYIAGAIAGCLYGGRIENCLDFKNTVTGYKRIGHLVGDARADGGEEDRRGYVINCYSDGKVVGDYNGGSKYIQNCESNVSADRFASGEVAYKLNGERNSIVWKQTLDTDAYPSFTGETVYATYIDCSTEEKVYRNTLISGTPFPHSFDEHGFCTNTSYTGTVCGGYQPAVKNGDFYEISNAGQLFWFAKRVNGGDTKINGKLMNPIDLENRAWTPVGNEAKQFAGEFDGQGYAITGLNLTATANYSGLFGYVTGMVQNFEISGTITVTGEDIKGIGVIGLLNGTASGIVSHINITVARNVTKSAYIGGVVGQLGFFDGNDCVVKQCLWDGSINIGTAKVDQTGGIVGYVWAGQTQTVTDCASYGTLKSSYSGASLSMGGIIGYVNNENFTMSNCVFAGSIDYGTGMTSTGDINAVGYINNAASITNVYYLAGSAPNVASGGSAALAQNGATSVTVDELKSGKITWLLNNKSSTGIWRQQIGADAYPSFTGPYVDFDENSGSANNNSVVELSIRWTEMSFTYDPGSWNPETHSYDGGTGWTPTDGGGQITITNTGGKTVTVSLSFESTMGDELTGSFTKVGDYLPYGKSFTSALSLSGAPSQTGFANEQIGTVSVKIGGNPGWKVGDKVEYVAKDGKTYTVTVAEITDEKAVLVGNDRYEKEGGYQKEAIEGWASAVGARYPKLDEKAYIDIVLPWYQEVLPYDPYRNYAGYADGRVIVNNGSQIVPEYTYENFYYGTVTVRWYYRFVWDVYF